MMKLFSFNPVAILVLTVIGFQSCTRMKFEDSGYKELASNSIQSFTTNEDTALDAQPKTFSGISLKPARFTVTRQPTHGTLTDFNLTNGKFTYMPASGYFGDDFFQYIEQEEGAASPHQVPINIDVIMNKQLAIITDMVTFDFNTIDNSFSIELKDKHDLNPHAFLSLDTTVAQVSTKNGILKKSAGDKFSYTPNTNYRGIDQYEFVAKNSFGQTVKKVVSLNVGNPFHELQPSMAVRGVGCVACHLSTASKLISDFGAGESYFFGKNAIAAGANPFETPFSFYNDHNGQALFSASLKEIIVPDVALPFKPGSFGLSPALTLAQSEATTLPKYLNAVRGLASVTTKNQVYIGAPTAATVISRTHLGAAPYTYIKNQDSSPTVTGLVNKGSYFEATQLTCDGDLAINGTLFLKNLELTTNSGCRIYVTGPIFVNGMINYNQVVKSPTNNTNLQLVSSSWINLGVGLNHCENASNNKGWYSDSPGGGVDPVSHQQSPLYHRLMLHPAATRAGVDSSRLRSIEQSIAGFEDSSCRTVAAGISPREVHFERLLLNAPRIDSRYKGQFTGVVIAEVALMSLSAFSFTFDPVFERVPILPMLLPSDYLIVK